MARPRASARPWAAAFAVALLLAGGAGAAELRDQGHGLRDQALAR
jgi:hypothetical protein